MSVPGFENVTLLECESCGELFTQDEVNESPLYECGGCEAVFNKDQTGSHQCPECNKFAGKIGEVSCPSCDTGPMNPVEGYLCEDCDFSTFDESDAREHRDEDHEDLDENLDEELPL